MTIANRPVSSLELSTISGYVDDDVKDSIRNLLSWRLLSRLEQDELGHPTFSCNRNTRRLVEKSYSGDPTYKSYLEVFRSSLGSSQPRALRMAVGRAIREATTYVRRGDLDSAARCLRSAMTGELESNPDLWGTLGWVHTRTGAGQSTSEARSAFEFAHRNGSRSYSIHRGSL